MNNMIKPEACLQCVKNKLRRFAEEKIINLDKRKIFVEDALVKVDEVAATEDPFLLEVTWERLAKETLETDDLYENEKEYYHNKIMKLENKIEKQLEASNNKLLDALKFSIAGNIIDFSAIQDITWNLVEDTIKETLKAQIDDDLFKRMIEDMQQGNKLVYLTDNVGEIVFDKIFIKNIKELFPHIDITLIVKGYPVSSDATEKEAYEVGIDKYAKIINNGNDITGTYLPQCSKECCTAIEEADLIVAKGMANFESLITTGYNIYYVFLCKCKYYAEILKVEKFSAMFINEIVHKSLFQVEESITQLEV